MQVKPILLSIKVDIKNVYVVIMYKVCKIKLCITKLLTESRHSKVITYIFNKISFSDFIKSFVK